MTDNIYEIRSGDLHNRDKILTPSTKFCLHGHLEVDMQKELVMCLDCGERITPMLALKQMMEAESILYRRIDTMKLILAKADKKNRCKCEKCGAMTRIER